MLLVYVTYIVLLNLFGLLHINLPSAPMSPKWSLSFRFSNQKARCYALHSYSGASQNCL